MRCISSFSKIKKPNRKLFASLSFAATLAFLPIAANSETISSAMAYAYSGNPQLNAQRAATRAADEGVPLARSGLRPKIFGNADYGVTHSEYAAGGLSRHTDLNPYGFGVTISQTLFDGLKTRNNVAAAEAAIKASRESLRNVEQNVLFDAASAYMNVLRDAAIASFRNQNLVFLREEVRAAQERFNVGESTRTDVAQAKARRASAKAQVAAARAQLKGAIGVYEQVIGRKPSHQKQAHNIDAHLPRQLSRAQAIAMREHPAILATHHLVDQASFNVKSAESDLLPTLKLEGAANRRFNSQADGDQTRSASIIAKLVVPIYQGGAISAKVRQNKELLGQNRIVVDQTRDQVRAAVTSSFAQLEAARVTVSAGVVQLRAAQLALAGIVEERNVGQRTTLDVLNTQQDVLNAQISLAGSRRDSIVAGYALLSAIGRLSAVRLKLRVAKYEPRQHYEAVRDKWHGLRTPDQR